MCIGNDMTRCWPLSGYGHFQLSVLAANYKISLLFFFLLDIQGIAHDIDLLTIFEPAETIAP